jgi:RNA polymerase sigma factor (sigma-70 family)
MSPGISTRLLATQSDERLVALARQGHERAFEALVLRYRRPLLGYCRRLSLPEARVEDVLQQALLKTWIALRGDAEVRDIKAWLYRVVHNTAINSVRDAARERERLSDPALRRGSNGQGDLERGLQLREALGEVAALPELQREVIVRTAVGGHSHERVASDLGITDGAVRGLLYRARSTLRTAVTALTPPPLLSWLAGGAERSGPAPEALGGLAGGGAAGLGGLLVKGGAVALTAGTLITGAVVHIQGSTRHHHSPARLASASAAAGSSERTSAIADTSREPVRVLAGASHAGSRRPLGRHADRGARLGGARTPSAIVLGGGRTVRWRASGDSARPPAPAHTVAESAPSEGPAQSQQGGGSPGQSDTTAQAGAGAGEPVGSAAGSGSAGGSSGASGASGSQGSGSMAPEGSGAGQSGTGEATGSGGSGAGESGSSGTGSGNSESGSGSGSGQSEGGVVGAVVHEVSGLLEHLLH